MQTLRTHGALFLVVFAAAAFGQAPALDQSRPEAVAKAYLQALASGDREAALRCLDPAKEGRGVAKLMDQVIPKDPTVDQTLTEMLLLPASRQAKYAPGEWTQQGDTARLAVVATVSLPQTLVLRKGPDGKWVVDLSKSAVASTGRVEPTLLRGVEHTEQTECSTNLKQLALAMLMWMQDHNETFPPAKGWGKELQPYINNLQVFRCPAAAGLECGYAYNIELAGKKMGQIERPSNTILFYESTLGTPDAADKGESQPRPGRHERANNVAYVDGHVARLPPQP